MANHASHAALPYPIKNARYTVQVPYLDADGDPTDPTTPDTEVSKDGGTFADCAEEVTTIAGTNGSGYLTLTGAETDCSMLMLAAKVASGPKATLMTVLPRVLPVVGSGTLSAGSAGGGTLGTLLAYDVTGCFIRTTGGTGGGGTGGAANQARKIITYNTGSGAFTVAPNWETTPSTDTTYDVLLPEGLTLGALRALNPGTAGRTLDVSTSGKVLLADGAHGGTAAVLTLERVVIAATTTNEPGVKVTGNGTGDGARFISGGSGGSGIKAEGQAIGLFAAGVGTNATGMIVAGNGTGDGLAALRGATGQDIDADIQGDITGSLSGSVGSVAAAGITAASFAAGAITSTVAPNLDAAVSTRATPAQVNIEADAALADAGVTTTRTGYLDKLNITGNVAASGEVLAIQNNTRVRIPIPGTMERPDSGTTAYELNLYLYDEAGNMETPDSTPTATARNEAGADRSANLSAVTNPGTGRYKATYSVASGHAIEQITIEWTVTEGGVARIHGAATQIVDTTAVDFTAADRAKLDTLHDTRITAGRAANLDNLDAAVSTRATPAQVRAESNGALVDNHLDHLLAADTPAPLPGSAGSILSDMLRDDGGQWSYNANALELAPAGGGGGGAAVILGAIQTTVRPGNRLSAPIALEMFIDEAKTFPLTVLDTNGAPVSLLGKTLRFVVFDTNVPTVAKFKCETGGDGITISGTSNEVALVAVIAAKANFASRDLQWALWDVAADAVLLWGPFGIAPARKVVP